MIKRIIDVSEKAYLHIKYGQLLIDKKNEVVVQVPVEDLGILILQHQAIVITQQTIITCQKNKVVVLFCDEKHLPYSAILPIAESNKLHSKILKQQLTVSKALKNRLWKQVIKNKIQQQSITLKLLNKRSSRIERLVSQVKSGDSSNCEATAAQIYWKKLFGLKFKRDPELEGVNGLLNYGYSIIRAMVARSICCAGLHPTIGIFHQNQYNSLCLADDLMEPFRPWIDYIVYQITLNGNDGINQSNKQILLELISNTVILDGHKIPFMISIHSFMANLKRCYNKEQKQLLYPVLEQRLVI